MLGAVCGQQPPNLTITSPAHGSFSTAANVTVTGTIANVNFANHQVVVNGVPASLNTTNGTWSISAPISPTTGTINPMYAELRSTVSGVVLKRRRIVVISGQSVADGAFSLNGVALRINDTGLNTLEPLIASGVSINPATLLPVGSVVVSNYCAIGGPFGSCLGRITARVANPPPSISGFAIDADSMTNFVAGDVDVFNLRIDLNLEGSGIAPSCGLRLTASNTQILGDYALLPDTVDASNVNVNQIGNPVVSFSNFNQQFTSGLCDFPLIGDLIQLIVGNVEPTVVSGFQSALADPDGGGPLDSPVADAIETALANITITGPIGDALAVNFESPLFDVAEDTAGITLGSDARITAEIGTGVGQCDAPAGSPDLPASYHVTEAFPPFGATTPVGGLPYGLAVSISTSAFNQLLKAQIECGLLRTSITEIDLGSGLGPVTAGTLSLFLPTLATWDPDLPMRLDLEPTVAPYLTGATGPGGEIAEIRIPQLELEVHINDGAHPGNTGLVMRGALDMRAGLGLTFDNLTSQLAFSVSSVTDLNIAFLQNNVSANEAQVATVLNFLLPDVLPALGDGLGAFPLPEFFGLSLQGVEVSRNGQFLTLFANLAP
ncbi:MAG: hypothetical protein DCC71_09765 [Proteobacteria bacterium]|nr:MAG: hypothetical protein DCC71_09765 [Pseudomonadota bacterium]